MNTSRLTKRHLYGIKRAANRDFISPDLHKQLSRRGIIRPFVEGVDSKRDRTEWLTSRVKGSTLWSAVLTEEARNHDWAQYSPKR